MIEVKTLSKRFGHKLAVDRVSFSVERGEVLGFLGPNGAGKSTTMRMITGFLPPTEGRVLIGGSDILEDPLEARRKMGYLPENAPVYPDMSVEAFLHFIAKIRGYHGAEAKGRVASAVEKCNLGDVRNQPVHTLSKGYKQRVCFAQSILHDPDYLVMDEPTDGLDPNQKHEVREMIRQMAQEKTIILSTHILEEVDAVCTRAIVITEGRIAADASPSSLRARSPRHGSVRLVLQSDGASESTAALRAQEWIGGVETSGTGAEAVFSIRPAEAGDSITERLLELCRESGFRVVSINEEEGRLDEVFRMITVSGGKEMQS